MAVGRGVYKTAGPDNTVLYKAYDHLGICRAVATVSAEWADSASDQGWGMWLDMHDAPTGDGFTAPSENPSPAQSVHLVA
jgi:hypothetical protein